MCYSDYLRHSYSMAAFTLNLIFRLSEASLLVLINRKRQIQHNMTVSRWLNSRQKKMSEILYFRT